MKPGRKDVKATIGALLCGALAYWLNYIGLDQETVIAVVSAVGILFGINIIAHMKTDIANLKSPTNYVVGYNPVKTDVSK